MYLSEIMKFTYKSSSLKFELLTLYPIIKNYLIQTEYLSCQKSENFHFIHIDIDYKATHRHGQSV